MATGNKSATVVAFTRTNNRRITIPRSAPSAIRLTGAQAKGAGLKKGDVIAFSKSTAEAKRTTKAVVNKNPKSVSNVYAAKATPIRTRTVLGP